MSEPTADTVTDFSPICPHCGEYVENLNHALLIKFIDKYDKPAMWCCVKCHGQFAIDCNLVWTTKKIRGGYERI